MLIPSPIFGELRYCIITRGDNATFHFNKIIVGNLETMSGYIQMEALEKRGFFSIVKYNLGKHFEPVEKSKDNHYWKNKKKTTNKHQTASKELKSRKKGQSPPWNSWESKMPSETRKRLITRGSE